MKIARKSKGASITAAPLYLPRGINLYAGKLCCLSLNLTLCVRIT